MEKFFYPPHSARSVITGPSECGKSLFLSNFILFIINEYEKIHLLTKFTSRFISKVNQMF